MVKEYNNFLEKFFQKRRFAKIIPYIKRERVLDFGSRDEKLKNFLTKDCKYQGCERDYSVIKGKLAKSTLKFLVWTGQIDKSEDTHTHIWSKKELFNLAKKFNLSLSYHTYANFFLSSSFNI